MDSKAPCFNNSDIQLADTRLVSKSSDHPHLSASARNEQQHVEAIEILKNENDGIIFAWLKLARSLEPISQPHPDDTCLTRGQVRAITALRHCPSNDISAWLHLARTSGTWIEHFTIAQADCPRRWYWSWRRLCLVVCPHVAARPRAQGATCPL